MPDYKAYFPEIVNPAGVNPSHHARPMPMTRIVRMAHP